jgi:hypothetical protein
LIPDLTGSRVGFTGELTDNGLVYLRARWMIVSPIPDPRSLIPDSRHR